MSRARWEAALTTMEDDLDTNEESVRLGEPALVPAWAPPADLGPLPPQLADRVSHLVRRIGLLSTFVQFQLLATQGDLAHLATHPEKTSGNRAVALFLDASV